MLLRSCILERRLFGSTGSDRVQSGYYTF